MFTLHPFWSGLSVFSLSSFSIPLPHRHVLFSLYAPFTPSALVCVQREAFRDQKLTVRMSDGSNMTLPPPSFVALALERLGLGATSKWVCFGSYMLALCDKVGVAKASTAPATI